MASVCLQDYYLMLPFGHSGFFGTPSHGLGMVGLFLRDWLATGGIGFFDEFDSPCSVRMYLAAASPPPGFGVVLF